MSRRRKKDKNKEKDPLARASALIFSKEKDFLVENLSTLIVSGVGVVSAIETIAEELKSRRVRVILDVLGEEVQSGTPLWRALGRTKLFQEHTIALIRVGEETGRLADNLRVVATQEQKDRSFKSKVRSAMIYPVFVLSITGVAGIGIAWFILPRLATVFSQLRLDLPIATKVLIKVGQFLDVYGAVFVPSFVVGLSILMYLIFGFSKTKHIGQAMLIHTPVIRRLIQESEVARFGFLLGTLLNAGLPITNALKSLVHATSIRKYKRFYTYLSEEITSGSSFAKSFKGYPKLKILMPIPVQQMVISSEESGSLSEMLLKIGQVYEEKIDTTTKDLAVALEPILLIIVGLGVMSIALAIILPIYGLLGGVNPDNRTELPIEIERTIEVEDQSVIIENELPALEILPSENGFAIVYDQPSNEGLEVSKVLQGQLFEYKADQGDWFQILLTETDNGWIYIDDVLLLE